MKQKIKNFFFCIDVFNNDECNQIVKEICDHKLNVFKYQIEGHIKYHGISLLTACNILESWNLEKMSDIDSICCVMYIFKKLKESNENKI